MEKKQYVKNCSLQELLNAAKCYLQNLTKSDLEGCYDSCQSWLRNMTNCVEFQGNYMLTLTQHHEEKFVKKN